MKSLALVLFVSLLALSSVPASAVDLPAPVAVPQANIPAGASQHPIPSNFPLPNGDLATRLFYDAAGPHLYFAPSDPLLNAFRMVLPAPVQSWAWSSVPGGLGWSELVCRLTNENMVGINPRLPRFQTPPLFPMRGRSYNDALSPITIEPLIRSTLGGTAKQCTFRTAAGGRIILAGTVNSYQGPFDWGAPFTPAPGNPTPAKVPDDDPTNGKRVDVTLENINATVDVPESSLPASSPASLAALVLLVGGFGLALTRRP